jgi:para-aminobenzoate synthetase/4-amino-4-deoxychorismate lyase
MPTLIDFSDPRSGQPSALRCAFDQPILVLVAHQHSEVRDVLRAVEQHAQAGRWCVGYVRYEAAPAFDAALQVHPADGPLAWFGVYDQAQPWPVEAQAPEPPTALAQWHTGPERSRFDTDMARIHAAIAAGDLYQINYTCPWQGTLHSTPQAMFHALQQAQPGGYAAFIDAGTEQVLSVSPELFFDWQGSRILARPMKGTAPRGRDAAEDQSNIEALQSSPKERAENVMIVDLLRNDLSRIAQPQSVQVPRLFQVEALPTVFQMSSDVVAETRPGTTLVDVFHALFPCGSITGAPKVQAMRLIHSLEPEARGVYCGAIGVVRPGGHATFNVAIRTVTSQQKQLRCGIGSGITHDATAEGEWQEWQAKRAFLNRASTPFELLETLRLEQGHFNAAERHLARMARAAQHFGFVFDRATVEATLAAQANAHPQGLFRVRLLLKRQGVARAESFVLAASDGTPQRVQLASTALEAAHSEFVRYKTTHRALYDAYAPTDATVFDTLLWNARGELTESTRCNVAMKLDGEWLTPALSCGLLDGIAREELIERGRLREAVIPIEALARAEGLALFNSLRGWMPATLVSPPQAADKRG